MTPITFDDTPLIDKWKKGDCSFTVTIDSQTLACKGCVDAEDKAIALGGFGRIFQIDGDDKQVIKLVRREPDSSLDKIAQESCFQYEIQKSGSTRLLGAEYAYYSKKFIFILMPKMGGQDLCDAMRSTSPPLIISDKKTILLNVLRGMQQLHALNILHRDLKPENIRLLPNNEVMIYDFGLSKKLDPDHPIRSTAGSRPYMSQEALLGNPQEASSDVASFGRIACELLMKPDKARHFFSNKKRIHDPYTAIQQKPTSFQNGVDQTLITAINQCLLFNPEERPKVEDLIQVFEAVQGQSQIGSVSAE